MRTMQPNRSLTVYKASAGSGKTFTLAKEYIKLLIADPLAFRSTLAVTFTNKATEEMKTRILAQLYGIWKGLPESAVYLKQIMEELDVSEAFAARQAGTALERLIHEYGHFRVETIDSFFQSVLRNLARELDLTANLRVGLNDRQVEQQAVDEMVEGLEAGSVLLKWILSYIQENMDEYKGWNVMGQLKRFGENIFKDRYKENAKALNAVLLDSRQFQAFTQRLRDLKRQSADELGQSAGRFFSCLERYGLDTDDFAYGTSGVCGYFCKMRNGCYDGSLLTKRVQDAMESADKWVKKKGDSQRIAAAREAVETELLALLRQTESQRPMLWKLYKSADITLKHMNQLRLLNSIEKKVRSLNAEANRFLLSDTQSLLHSLISESDSPFIFEKIGTQLEHVMIDEFQDTSVIQWRNFKVLLEECMSRQDKGNMLVGDVKQSIYRWRSGDWRLLNDIDSQFPNSHIDIRTLQTNYRSEPAIIRFNNAFFRTAAQLEYERIVDEDPNAEALKRAYADVEQELPGNREHGGRVHVELLTGDDYAEQTMERLGEEIERYLANGVQQKDMAILVRSNRNIQYIADSLAESKPHLHIVSDEAFRLDSSLAVNIITEALRCLVHPQDEVARAFLVKAYQKRIMGNPCTETGLFVTDRETELLPEEYASGRQTLLTLPLYSLVERIYTIFRLRQLSDDDAFVCAFFDQLTGFIGSNPADIDAFLNEWDSNLHEKTIQADAVDGIRLITIHKSKGLEYGHVFMPFCDWKLENGGILWCTPKEEPFSQLPVVPVDYSMKQMKGTVYEQDCMEERLQSCVDNLNLLYVAFTRATKSLTVFGKRGNSGIRSAIIEQCLPQLQDELPQAESQGDSNSKDDTLTFSYGQEDFGQWTGKTEKHSSRNVFLQRPEDRRAGIDTFRQHVEFRQSNQSRSFTVTDEKEEQQETYIKLGNVLHALLSTIRTTADFGPALSRLETEGVIYDEEISRERLHDLLARRLENPTVAAWFSDRWEVFNECSIVYRDAVSGELSTHRPDRVMTDGKETIVVDFKFGTPKPEYHDQVRRYMTLLEDMGHSHVKGYLWFVYSNRIEEIK